jgi:hypothetical protein
MTSRLDWSRKFDEPIILPNGRKLVTLKDAGTYITKLPKAEHTAPEWQAAIHSITLHDCKGGCKVLFLLSMQSQLAQRA